MSSSRPHLCMVWNNWLIYFRRVETTNQVCIFSAMAKCLTSFVHHVLVRLATEFGSQSQDANMMTAISEQLICTAHELFLGLVPGVLPSDGVYIAMDRKWGVPNGPACFCWYKTILFYFNFGDQWFWTIPESRNDATKCPLSLVQLVQPRNDIGLFRFVQ